MIAGHGVFRTCEQVQSDTRISSSLASEAGVARKPYEIVCRGRSVRFRCAFGDAAEITAYMLSKIDKREPVAKRLGQ